VEIAVSPGKIRNFRSEPLKCRKKKSDDSKKTGIRAGIPLGLPEGGEIWQNITGHGLGKYRNPIRVLNAT
jgi:hypothetical protein